jgi:hypothetical protein
VTYSHVISCWILQKRQKKGSKFAVCTHKIMALPVKIMQRLVDSMKLVRSLLHSQQFFFVWSIRNPYKGGAAGNGRIHEISVKLMQSWPHLIPVSVSGQFPRSQTISSCNHYCRHGWWGWVGEGEQEIIIHPLSRYIMYANKWSIKRQHLWKP